MSDLAVETTEVAADHDRFVAYKRAVFSYLNTFVARFTELVPLIVDLVAELDPAMPELLALAAALDTAPNARGDDQGPLEMFERRWRGVRPLAVGCGVRRLCRPPPHRPGRRRGGRASSQLLGRRPGGDRSSLSGRRRAGRPRSCRSLAGHVPPARWDVDLAPAIEHSGVEVEEEQVLGELLADLQPGGA